jgi:hypothetical protein
MLHDIKLKHAEIQNIESSKQSKGKLPAENRLASTGKVDHGVAAGTVSVLQSSGTFQKVHIRFVALNEAAGRLEVSPVDLRSAMAPSTSQIARQNLQKNATRKLRKRESCKKTMKNENRNNKQMLKKINVQKN